MPGAEATAAWRQDLQASTQPRALQARHPLLLQLRAPRVKGLLSNRPPDLAHLSPSVPATCPVVPASSWDGGRQLRRAGDGRATPRPSPSRLRAAMPFPTPHRCAGLPGPPRPARTLGSRPDGWGQAVPTGHSAPSSAPSLLYAPQLLTEEDRLSLPSRKDRGKAALLPRALRRRPSPGRAPSHVFIFLELQCSSCGRMDTSMSSFGSSLAKV